MDGSTPEKTKGEEEMDVWRLWMTYVTADNSFFKKPKLFNQMFF